ncbi:MAG TPA: hypothetical protein VF190_03070 [Rhodothermales bacterium]
MKQILSAAAVSLAFAVTVSAQATPQSQSSSQSPPSSSASGQKSEKSQKKTASSVTLTGCLRQGADPNSFELQNVQMTGSSASSASSGTSTSASSTAGTGTSTGMSAGTSGNEMGSVKLIVSDDIDLKPHVGHRVEVRGSMANGMMKDKGATGTAGGKDKEGKERTLRVRSLRHISETCS